MKKNIATTNNGINVSVIIENEHMLAHPSVTDEILAEALTKVEYAPPFWMGTVDIGRVIGTDACVETTDADDIRYECRPGREIKSRMVYGRKPESTTLLTIGICTDDDGIETVFTAFPGLKAPKELEDPRLTESERAEAEAFWATHALCAES